MDAATLTVPTPVRPAPEPPPAEPVTGLILSPVWPDDQTLFALRGRDLGQDDCYVFNQPGGQFQLSPDGGQSWRLPHLTPAGDCQLVTALAVSPAYPHDKTLFAALAGLGIFRSTDGGQSWQSVGRGLTNVGLAQLLISPGFETDGTILARPFSGNLQRSTDGGQTWQEIAERAIYLTLSPEFERDGILVSLAYSGPEGRLEIRRSDDRGQSWYSAGSPPPDVRFDYLSPAPLFSRWGVLFAYGSDQGLLYRSDDGGVSWQSVLESGLPGHKSGGMVYGPDEANRAAYLLVTGQPESAGRLYRSPDGGQTWQLTMLPDDLNPTVLAGPPDAVDQVSLFLGTIDGQVRPVDLPKE